MQIKLSKNLAFERRYPRETVERIKAWLRDVVRECDPMPSYRELARCVEHNFYVNISGATVKRLLNKCTAPSAPPNLKT